MSETGPAPSSVPLTRDESDRARIARLPTRNAVLRVALSLVLAGLVFAFGVWRLDIDVGSVARQVARAHPWYLIAALVAYYGSMPLRAWRWRILLMHAEDDAARSRSLPGFATLVHLYLLGWLVNCLLPAKLGELYRSYLLTRRSNARLASTIGTVITERASDVLALAAGFLASGLTVFGADLFRGMHTWVEWALVLGGATFTGFLGGYIVRHRLVPYVPQRARSLYWSLQRGLFGAAGQWPTLTVLTAWIWLLEGARFYLAARAVGLALPISVAFLAALLASLLTTLPLTPAGVGFVEAGVVGLLLLLGIDQTSAVSAAVLDRIVAYWSVLLIGPPLWLLWRWRAERYHARSH